MYDPPVLVNDFQHEPLRFYRKFTMPPSQNFKPLVTVVTPVFNQSETIAETITSVLNQSYKNIEYIVVNDGSDDQTELRLRGFNDQIKIIYQEHAGQAAAINNGWRHAKGQYLTYVSGDDILYYNSLQGLVDAVDSEVSVLYSDYDLIDSKSRKIKTLITKEYSKTEMITKLTCFPALVPLIRNESFVAVGGWDTNYRFIPDFEFWTRMARLGDFRKIHQVSGAVRVHHLSGSLRAMDTAMSDEIIKLVNSDNWKELTGPVRAYKARAFMMSARNHFQSNRLKIAWDRYFQAIKADPFQALSISNIFFVTSGCIRRPFYKIRGFILDLVDGL